MNNLQKVQKKRKVNKVAPFWIFSMDFKKKMNLKGRIFLSDREFQDCAGYEWSKLSEQERNVYKNKSKTMNPIINKERIIYNSKGENIAEVEARQKSETQKYVSMLEEIENMLKDSNDVGDLDNLVFHFLSVSSFYSGAEGVFPAELALSKFSLRNGIFNDIQIRINPGALPLGTRGDATEIMKKHKYDLPPDCEGEKDYSVILQMIMEFIRPLDEIPIFFTEGNTRDDKEPFIDACRIIDKICFEAQEDDLRSHFKIYPIDELLFQLNRMAIENKNRLNGTEERSFLSIAMASSKMKNAYLGLFTEGCEYHNDKEAQEHCCLAKVRNFGYNLAKWCANGKKYQLKEGNHFPSGLALEAFTNG